MSHYILKTPPKAKPASPFAGFYNQTEALWMSVQQSLSKDQKKAKKYERGLFY
jgi:hypothetical protein